jgi:hydantoinase/carbamoylase family amidase
MQEAALGVRVDPVGNVVGRLAGAPGGRTLLVGSHLDTVRDAGRYDGPLGVLAGIALAQRLADVELPFALEVLAFADEEGLRYGTPYLGSRVVAGSFRPEDLDRLDAEGIPMRDAIIAADGDPAAFTAEARRREDVLGYVELHIEQGPVLEQRGEPAAAVLGTFGVERRVAVFSGRAAHAGATPMDLRQDSFLAAAAAALAIREVGVAHPGGVCTTGGATSEPGVVTAIAGRTEMLLDQRHLDAGELAAMLAEADAACEQAAADQGCTVELRHLWSIPPIPFDERLIGFAQQAIGKDLAIPSGPLHDAAEMARLIPTVMLFSSSSPPVSHTPEEDTPEADLRIAIEAYGATVAATLAAAAEGDLPPRE